MKKLISLVLALALIIVSCSIAFAEWTGNGGNKTITVNNALNGETYSIYQLFDATTNGTDIAYTLMGDATDVPSEVSGIFKLETLTDDAGFTYKAITKNGTPSDNDVQTALKAYVAGSGASKKVGEIPCTANVVNFTNLKDGYYVIVSTFKGKTDKCIGTSTTDNGIAVYEKNETIPQPDKTVEKKSYSIGDTITYTVTFPGANYYGSGKTAKIVTAYTVSDTLPPYLSGATVQSVTIDNDGTTVTLTPVPQFENKSFTIPWAEKVGDKWQSLYKNASEVTIVYTAVLTDVTNIGAADVNTVSVSPELEGEPTEFHWDDKEEVFTYGAALKKVDEEGNPLKGAQFKFANVIATETAPGIYTVNSIKAENAGSETVMTVNDDGLLYIIGLESKKALTGEETKAPEGFNKLEGNFTLNTPETLSTKVTKVEGYAKYDEDGNLIEWHEDTFTGGTLEEQDLSALTPYILPIENHKGTELPSTGGIGTTIFYVLGGLLVVGAAIILVSRRKAHD